ncbi:ABC transporter ATP-binding protein [Zavarzinia sp.]|uniref:ABC transporter ATP-binding protein n=1 Tax=Zavarzinia sp. TaxID=2027920 RepID=UPI003BB7DE04
MLKTEAIAKHFGGLEVLSDVNLTVGQGEIVGLLGPNGSGKTTLLNILSGFLRSSAGRIRYDGRDITGLPPEEIARLGMRRTFQLPRMPDKMSCAELLLTAVPQPVGTRLFSRPGKARAEAREASRRAFEMLERLELTRVAHQPASGISGGQQKLLALGAAILGGARLLLLDEPTAGVNPTLRLRLVETLQEIRRQGVTLVVVEHDMGFIGRLCDRCVVLDRGVFIADCKPEQLMENERVVEAYLGKRERRPVPPVAHPHAAEA